MGTGEYPAALRALYDLFEELFTLSDDREAVRRLVRFTEKWEDSVLSKGASGAAAQQVVDIAAMATAIAAVRGCVSQKERSAAREEEQSLRRMNQDLMKKNMLLRERTMVDELTGLFNRRYFERSLVYDIERFRRYHRPFGVVLFDVDFFKKINDTYGHSIGDAALRHLSLLARETIRSADMVARYGGEEFVLLLPETTVEGAFILAERLRKKVASTPFATDKGELWVNISLGVFAVEGDFQGDAEEVMRIVDNALYAAKGAGRNCCVVA